MDLNLSPAITPAKIVVANKKLSIPIYQRLFVWGEAQIDALLNDLWNARSNNENYYLGVITVHENDLQQWEIVDGQQRLTFLTLLGCLLKKNNCDVANNWDGFVFVGDEQKEPRLFFHGRHEDRKDILNYVTDSSSEFANYAFARFAERFSLFSKGKGDLQRFSEYCFEHAAFLVNELPNAYGPEELNLYFEKMNSTGRQLTPLEVVKGKWFSPYAARWNACMNFDRRFAKAPSNTSEVDASVDSIPLQDMLLEVVPENDTQPTVGSTKSPRDVCPPPGRLVMREEMLTLHVLRLHTGNIEIALNREKLIETFNKSFSAQQAAAFIEALEKYRTWIDENIIYLEEDGGKYDYKFRSETNAKQKQNDEEEEEDVKCMRQFQAMLYVASGESQKWVLDAYVELQGGKLTFDFLRHYDANNHKPDASALSYHKIDRYWFWKLEYLLWEEGHLCQKERGKNQTYSVALGVGNTQTTFYFDEKERQSLLSYKFRRNISIEHLHPQSKGDTEWGYREDSDSPMHQFGNLAMISPGKNSAQSADGIGTKLGRLSDWLSAGDSLESIKMLLMFKLCDGVMERWTPALAHKHGDDMIKLLEEDWEHWYKSESGK